MSYHVIYTPYIDTLNSVCACYVYPDEREGDGGGVQYRLGHVAVEVGAGRGEAGDVLGQAVVGVVQPAVQVGHPVQVCSDRTPCTLYLAAPVVCLASHVAAVSLACQSASEGQRHLGLQIPASQVENGSKIVTCLVAPYQRVDEGCGHGDPEPDC